MTRLLDDPRALLELPADTLLAVDTEFHAERRYTPRLHLVQVRAPDHEPWLIDPENDELWRAVAPKLPLHPWLVHAGSQDLVLLRRALGRLPERVLDTQIAAGLVQTRYPASLQYLLERYLGVTIDKAAALSDWSRRPLSAEQLRYAAADVLHLHDLWEAIVSCRPDRTELIAAACAEAHELALLPDALAWLRIPGRQRLDPQQGAVLRALSAWRDEEARQADQPPGSILGNGLLLTLAKRMPTSLEALLQGRRTPKKVLRRHADALLSTIATARETDPHTWPPTLRPGTKRFARHAWLCAWAEQIALEHEWSRRLITPDHLLERWVDDLHVEGWRTALLEPVRTSLGEPLRLPASA